MRVRWHSQVIHCAIRFALVLVLAFPPPAFAWGKAGHRVVATLATSAGEGPTLIDRFLISRTSADTEVTGENPLVLLWQ